LEKELENMTWYNGKRTLTLANTCADKEPCIVNSHCDAAGGSTCDCSVALGLEKLVTYFVGPFEEVPAISTLDTEPIDEASASRKKRN
jgi:hypothetical protein